MIDMRLRNHGWRDVDDALAYLKEVHCSRISTALRIHDARSGSWISWPTVRVIPVHACACAGNISGFPGESSRTTLMTDSHVNRLGAWIVSMAPLRPLLAVCQLWAFAVFCL
jgi:hypothetical protein